VILVTVGSSGVAFDRLLEQIETLDVDEEILVQHGPSRITPRNARCVPFLHFTELEGAIASARLVVTHAGVGSVLLTLMNGKQPIVVPREHRFGEVVDDHQVHLAERLAREGLVKLVRDADQLQAALRDFEDALVAAPTGGGNLLGDLADYLRRTLDGGRG
jgi:UDP-N-acetylglucosamine transferase subunit ALG13